ncbi:MAG: hypothetical protein ACT4P1_15970 [Sporichthyaceae bacterium]
MADLVLFAAMVATLLVSMACAFARAGQASGRVWCHVAPWPPLVMVVALTVYVTSEDDYANRDRSRWATYDAQLITSVAIGAGLLAALLGFALRRRPGWMEATAFASFAAAILTYFARAQMSN